MPEPLAGAAQALAGEGPREGWGKKGAATSGCGRPLPRTGAPGARGRPGASGRKVPLSSSSHHEIRSPKPGKTLGPMTRASPRKGHGPPPFPDVSLLLPRKNYLPLVGVYWLPPPCGKSWPLGCKVGSSEQNSLPLYVCHAGKGNKKHPLRPQSNMHVPLECGRVLPEGRSWPLRLLN